MKKPNTKKKWFDDWYFEWTPKGGLIFKIPILDIEMFHLSDLEQLLESVLKEMRENTIEEIMEKAKITIIPFPKEKPEEYCDCRDNSKILVPCLNCANGQHDEHCQPNTNDEHLEKEVIKELIKPKGEDK